MKNIESFDTFINEMYSGPADGAKYVKSFNDKQSNLGYFPNAVGSEEGSPGNPAVGEDVSMMSDRLGDIEPEAYPSSGGQDFKVTQPGSAQLSTNPASLSRPIQ